MIDLRPPIDRECPGDRSSREDRTYRRPDIKPDFRGAGVLDIHPDIPIVKEKIEGPIRKLWTSCGEGTLIDFTSGESTKNTHIWRRRTTRRTESEKGEDKERERKKRGERERKRKERKRVEWKKERERKRVWFLFLA